MKCYPQPSWEWNFTKTYLGFPTSFQSTIKYSCPNLTLGLWRMWAA